VKPRPLEHVEAVPEESMPVIHVFLYEGRTKEQKAELAQAITDDVVRIMKTTPEATHVVYHDTRRSDWAIAGKLAG
jgi:4-oxalocrotonate tautomerase